MSRTSPLLSPEIMHAIRNLEITTKRLLNGAMVGDIRSAQRGTGFEFDQIRDYSNGDDVRFIDWKAYARTQKFLIKEYREERSRTVVLLVDMSASHNFCSTDLTKKMLAIQVASALALIAAYGNDRISLMIYTSNCEKYIAPDYGLDHARMIMETLFTFEPQCNKTCLAQSLLSVMPKRRKDCVIALISDFVDNTLADAFTLLSKKTDIMAFRCSDKNESVFPDVGFVPLEDLETGRSFMYDARGHSQRNFQKIYKKSMRDQEAFFRTYKIDMIDVVTDRPWLSDVISFFKRRMRY